MATEQVPETFTASIFLAGPTPRDPVTPSWRPQALELLAEAGFDGLVLDPERRHSWDGDYVDQGDWETEALRRADVVLFWVPRDLDVLPGFTTNVEFGLWAPSGHAVLGAPPGAPGTRYLRATAERFAVPCFDTLSDTVAAAVDLAQRFAVERTGPERVASPLWSTSLPDFLADLRSVGHELVDLSTVATFPAKTGTVPFLWVVHPTVAVAGEDRRKGNEVVVGRPDITAVVAHGRGPDPEIVLVGEYRAAARNGLAWTLPSGSVEGEDLAASAAREFGSKVRQMLPESRLPGPGRAASLDSV